MAELSAQPEPTTEPAEPNPGGVDALPDDGGRETPDLAPEDNPAIDDQVPDDVMASMAEDDDTSTSATRSADGRDDEPQPEHEHESPA